MTAPDFSQMPARPRQDLRPDPRGRRTRRRGCRRRRHRLVCYAGSPRYVDVARAAALAERVAPFVSVVGLFVNADAEEVAHVAERVPLTLLQFHGDETPEQCAEIARRCRLPFVRAARVRPGLDLVEFADQYRDAAGLLLDAFVEGYGGGGHVFDWTLIPGQWLPTDPALVFTSQPAPSVPPRAARTQTALLASF